MNKTYFAENLKVLSTYLVWFPRALFNQAWIFLRYWVYLCRLSDLVCLTGESHWQCCERLPQGTCVSRRWKFWI